MYSKWIYDTLFNNEFVYYLHIGIFPDIVIKHRKLLDSALLLKWDFYFTHNF